MNSCTKTKSEAALGSRFCFGSQMNLHLDRSHIRVEGMTLWKGHMVPLLCLEDAVLMLKKWLKCLAFASCLESLAASSPPCNMPTPTETPRPKPNVNPKSWQCNILPSTGSAMSSTLVIQQPQPVLVSRESDEWGSGICDCCQDVPECKEQIWEETKLLLSMAYSFNENEKYLLLKLYFKIMH